MEPQEFQFSPLSTIGEQKRRLIAAKEYRDIPLHSSLEATLASLNHLSSASDSVVTKAQLWKESLLSVKPLLLASTAWQSVAIVGMVLSLLATRYVLVVDKGVFFTLCICCSYLVAEVSKNLVHYYDMPRRAQLARGVQLHLFAKINRKLLVIDPAQRSEFTTGNVKTLVAGDVEAVEDFITAASQAWIPALLTLCLSTPPILYLTGTLGAVGIGCTLLQLPLAIVAARFVERFKGKRQIEQDRLTTVLGEWVKNVRLVRYLHRESALVREIAWIVKRFSIESIKAHTVILASFALTYSWWTVPILAMVLASSWWSIPLSASSFFPALWLLSLLSNQVQFLPHSLTHYGTAAAAISRLERFFNLATITRFITDSTSRNDQIGDQIGVPVAVVIRDLTLTYNREVVLAIPSLTIEVAQRTAIVGEVGAGKSTFLQLICGEIAPTSGSIEIEFSSGVRASLWCSEVRERWRKYISYSPQEPFLSNATLRSNIDLFGDTTSSSLEGAIASAHLSNDVSLLEHGLEQEVGETGINLSGGQRQRVSLARAFLSKRPYMVLDDPLSAVDAATESILIQNFIQESYGLLLVSHRMDHLRLCDRVLVLQAGRIVEDGSPTELGNNPESAYGTLLFARSGGRS